MSDIPTQINTGRTGLDGMSKALARCCIIFGKYETKARAALAVLHTSGTLSDADYALATTFLDNVRGYCRVFKSSADVVGFYHP